MTHRLALVGTGSMGALHARVISQSERAELVRVIDPRAEAGRDVATRFSVDWTPEIDSLSDVDAVVLSAPTEMHHELALDVLHEGKPLLIEKPVANDLTEVRNILDVSAAREVPLMCGLLERYNPAVLTARALLGEPVHVRSARHGPYAARIRTGVAWDLLVHDVDLAIQLFGGTTPRDTTAAAGYFHPQSLAGAEDTLEALLSFDRGLASVSASRIGQRKIRTLTVSELDRLIEIDLLRRDVTIYRHVSHEGVSDGGRGYRQQTVIEIPELLTVREPLASQLDRFLDLVEGSGDPDTERNSILPSHLVVSNVLTQAGC
ncbi:Gfo/Idh/MocA family oxidoreductase [Haloechinothrix sp. YIM 98757]|uniref:Gfo/Idh/MocA family oxidoreductase n=1 Tax=Haloechinothrix aidingensis TaxID=2752311 RepID=A0A838A5F8_9PSEU|nr:Gfo/Idh/MocA family oxidoreductase [Haloechinothrix aidingensis]MBA0124208.1 Gfo/Idh/MocA family oxidoreductase [Haloechinothrix aidingensis]